MKSGRPHPWAAHRCAVLGALHRLGPATLEDIIRNTPPQTPLLPTQYVDYRNVLTDLVSSGDVVTDGLGRWALT